MSYTNLVEALRSLKLQGMLDAFTELTEQPGFAGLSKESLLDTLTRAELSDRKTRSINYQMYTARFPLARSLDDFNFSESVVNEEQINMLHQGHFIDNRRNIVLVGGTGTGKSHLGIAIATEAVRNRHKARFFNVVDLVNQLEQEKRLGRPGALCERGT